MKALFVKAALTVPGVTAAKVFIVALSDRGVRGQVQITDYTGKTTAAAF